MAFHSQQSLVWLVGIALQEEEQLLLVEVLLVVLFLVLHAVLMELLQLLLLVVVVLDLAVEKEPGTALLMLGLLLLLCFNTKPYFWGRTCKPWGPGGEACSAHFRLVPYLKSSDL